MIQTVAISSLKSILATLGMFSLGAIIITSISELNTTDINNKPIHTYVKHDPSDFPYKSPNNNGLMEEIIQIIQLFIGTNIFGWILGLGPPEDKNISWFYRKTSLFSETWATTLITSWCWMRSVLYTMISYAHSMYPLRQRMNNQGKLVESIFYKILGMILIWSSGFFVMISSIIPPIAGLIGFFIGINMTISSSILYASIVGWIPQLCILLCLIFPAFIIYWIQYFHNIFVLYSTAFTVKDERYTINKVFIYLIQNYKFLILLMTIIPLCFKWLPDGKFSEFGIDISFTLVFLMIAYFLIKQIEKINISNYI